MLNRPMTSPRRTPATWLCLALALVLSISLSAAQPIKAYPALTLKDGRQFTAVEVVSYASNGVLARHSDGVTTFRTGILPDHVLADLHLSAGIAAGGSTANASSFDPRLADRPAVAESVASDIAHRPAVAAPAAASTHSSPNDGAALEFLADKPAIAAGTAEPVPAAIAADAPAPAGEGNIPEFFVNQTAPVPASANQQNGTISGRVVVKLPSGETRLLADASIKAYPAHLLAAYLEKAKAHREQEAQKLIEQANAAEKAGAPAEARALVARARELSTRYLDDLPATPYSTRSDEFGHFTLRHELRDARIVASARLIGPAGDWTYEWIDVVPSEETLLNETNATQVIAPAAPNLPRFTAR